MQHIRWTSLLLWGAIIVMAGAPAQATVPPKDGGRFPKAYYDRLKRNPKTFTYSRALRPLVERVRRNRLMMSSPGAPAQAPGPTAVAGLRKIPVLPFQYADTTGEPFAVPNLQKELFDGPWPTGTMTDFYKEISYGKFSVTGTVFPWKKLKHKGIFYEGANPSPGKFCNGLCNASKVPAMLTDALNASPGIDWAQFDNDGPDGIPNSGDDDGYVDFVAFVQPQIGGECGKNPGIWSHRSNLSGWGVPEYTTKSKKAGGGFIKINDYVIMPSLACDGTTMIQIGVFCHEFGHAFGLPDLYDTDPDNGDSEGAGNWCLMAAGSWGGDGKSPERPSHMSAWSKTFLGWITPTLVTTGLSPGSLKRVEDNAVVYKIPILGNGGLPTKQYYLIENRQQTKFDSKLPSGGLLVWKINDAVVEPGLQNNQVNADVHNKGVGLIEADNKNEMDSATNRGDDGDPFPGKNKVHAFDNVSAPKSIGKVALCDISASGDTMTVRIVLTGRCQAVNPSPAVAVPASLQATPASTDDQAAPPPPPEAVSLSDLADHPERFLNQTIKVVGRLENLGKNYFTDRRLVLKGSDDATSLKSLAVKAPGVPLEVFPGPPGSRSMAAGQPRTLANYLGKDVDVVAVVERDDSGRYILGIKSVSARR